MLNIAGTPWPERRRDLTGAADLRPARAPRCPRCGAYLRPYVVWFGEALPPGALAAATEAAAQCDILLSVGTSGLVFPAASLVPLALDAGADAIVVNPKPQSHAHGARVHHLAAPAARALPALVEAAWG